MKKITLITLLLACALTSLAQNTTKTIEGTNIQGIAVNALFEVEIHKGETSSAEIIYPQRYAKKMNIDVSKDGVLFVLIKKLGDTNIADEFKVKLTVPTLNHITTAGNTVVNCYGTHFCEGEFTIKQSDNSVVNNLDINSNIAISFLFDQSSLNNAKINASRQIMMDVNTQTNVSFKQLKCSAFELYISDLAKLKATNVDIAGMCFIFAKENSNVILEGIAPYANVTATGMSNVDMLNCPSQEIQVRGRGMSTISSEFSILANVNLSILSEFRYKGNGRCEGNRNMIKL